jgi:predicted neuraminidase
VEISEDKGVHWKKIGPIALPHRKFGAIEPALFFDQEGNLRMVCRDRAHKIGEKGYIWEAVSLDGGYHWSEFEQTNLPNPDSGLDLVNLGEGRVILFYNHSHTNRFPLNLAVSVDGGNSWSEPLILADVGEFPAAILTTDGLIHITYASAPSTLGQRRIKHVVIDPTKLAEISETLE